MKKIFITLSIIALMLVGFNIQAQTNYQLVNNDFESWNSTSSTAIPTGWHSFSEANCGLTGLASLGCSSIKTNHHYRRSGSRPGGTGSTFVELYTKTTWGHLANGNMTNGQIQVCSSDAESTENNNKTVRGSYCQTFTATPDSVYFWYSYYAASSDSRASVRVYIHDNYDFVDHVNVDMSAHTNRKIVRSLTRTVSTRNTYSWVQVKEPFVLGTASANYVLVSLASNEVPEGGSENDALSIDDIVFIYSAWATGIDFAGQSVPNFSKSNFNYVTTVEYVSDLAGITTESFNVFTEVSDVTKNITITDATYEGRPAKEATITITAEDRVTTKVYHVIIYALNDDPVYYNVTASANPTAGGSVSPASGTYPGGSTVTLTATPSTCYSFTQWSDGVTTNPRPVTVSRDSTLVAQFARLQYTITAEASPAGGGMVSGSGTYNCDSVVFLEANPSTGYEFVEWQDGNTDNPRQISVTGDATYTATFQVKNYTVTAVPNNALWGSVSGAGTYAHGASVTVEATPATDYHFVRWSNNLTVNPYTFTVTDNVNLTAFFEMDDINYYDVMVLSDNTTMGTAEGTASVREGYTTVISATPNTGYHFTQWNDGNTDNPRTVTVTGDVTYTASFAPNSYTITALSANETMGTVDGTDSYNYGTTATLTANAATGYQFTQWNDGNTSNPREVSVASDSTFTAYFERISFTVTALSSNNLFGTTTGSDSYFYGETATLLATAEDGYHFVRWNNGVTDNPYIFEVYENVTVTALFEEDGVLINYYTVTATSATPTMGSVTGGGEYEENTSAVLTAIPATGHEFVAWNDGNTDNPRTITVVSDTSFSATFQPMSFQISVTANPTVGGVVTGEGTYTYGQTATLTATPNNGYEFTRWSDGNLNATRTVNVTGNASYEAIFTQQQYTINITVNNANFGSATGSGVYHYGDQVTATATPATGYQFVRWSNNETANPYTFEAQGDLTLIATFAAQAVEYYTVTASSEDAAMGEVTGGGVYTSGSTATLTAVPSTGYHFVAWNDGNTDNPRTVTVTSDTTLSASFAINTYTVQLVVNDPAMGSVDGEGTYTYLEQVTISATPNPGYHFVAWDNGVAQETYTFPITGDVTLTAVFAEDEAVTYTITVTSADENRGQAYGGGTFNAGDTIEIYAVAAPQYAFLRWHDGNTSNPRTIVVTGSASYIAFFQLASAIFEAPEAHVRAWSEYGRLYVNGVEHHNVIVTDMMGRVLYRQNDCQFDSFNIAVPTTGIYLVHADGVSTKKVLVKK